MGLRAELARENRPLSTQHLSTGDFLELFFSSIAPEYPAHSPGKFMATQRLTEGPGQDSGED